MSRECVCDITEQCVSNFTLALIAVGVCMTLASLLWPIEPYYIPNEHLSAKENEDKQQAHALMMTTLDAISAVGMGLLALGAILTSVLLTKVIVIDECKRSSRNKKEQCNQQQVPTQHQQQGQSSDSHDVEKHQEEAVTSINGSSVFWQKEKTELPSTKHHSKPPSAKHHSKSPSTKHHSKLPSDKDKLVDANHLEMNRDFNNVKPYGSVRH